MLTLNSIIKELKNIPVNRLEEVYSVIHSLRVNAKKSEADRNRILSFAGSFKDMSSKDYDDFLEEARKARAGLFDRNFDL